MAEESVTTAGTLSVLTQQGFDLLRKDDPDLWRMLEADHRRQVESLVMVASCSVVDPSVLVCQATTVANVTAEGYPGRRFHAGCVNVDHIEQLAVNRTCAAFGARYANVQPHSASVANAVVLGGLLQPGDTLLGMDLQQGGHLSHGSPVSLSGQLYRAAGYGLTASGLIDYEQVRRLAHELRPKMIISGATAYSRTVDFARFRAIADEVGALLMADISHIAGLVIAGLHPNPIDHAHVTTTCTHKQLYGPRGGLIMSGRDADSLTPDGRRTLRVAMQRAVFPYMQGAPAVNVIAAKASALRWCSSAEFGELAARIVTDAAALASAFARRGYLVVSGGTDNHIVLLDLTGRGMSGLVAERALESCGIVVNKNHVPGDSRGSHVTSGLRLGTNTLAMRGAQPGDMDFCADLVDRVLTAVEPVDDTSFHLDEQVRDAVREDVARAARRWPLPYPAP